MRDAVMFDDNDQSYNVINNVTITTAKPIVIDYQNRNNCDIINVCSNVGQHRPSGDIDVHEHECNSRCRDCFLQVQQPVLQLLPAMLSRRTTTLR
jgi:hypothetical protein